MNWLRFEMRLPRKWRGSRAGIENAQPVSSYKKRDGNKRIVTYVEQVATEHSARDGTHIRENDPHENEQCDLHPATPKLRRVQQTEKYSRRDDSRSYSEAPRDQRIKIAAENCLFDHWRQQDRHQHEQQGRAAILEQLLHWQLCFCAKDGRTDLNEQRERKPTRDQPQVGPGATDAMCFQMTPAESSPEGRMKTHTRLHEQVAEQHEEQYYLADYNEESFGASRLLKTRERHAE